MKDAEMVSHIKQRLGITGSYHDTMLLRLANDVKAYMVSAGVKNKVVNDEASIGCIARGVADLWNYGAGEGRFSNYFYERVIQLSMPASGIEDGSDEYDPIEDETIDDLIGLDKNPNYIAPDDIDNAIEGAGKPSSGEIEGSVEDDYEALTEKEIAGLF